VALFWVLGLAFIAMGVIKTAATPADDEAKAYTAAEDASSEAASEATPEEEEAEAAATDEGSESAE